MRVGGEEGGERALEMQRARADRAYRCRLKQQGGMRSDLSEYTSARVMKGAHSRCLVMDITFRSLTLLLPYSIFLFQSSVCHE